MRELVPYLAKLGAGDVYTSPLFAARSGSTHGYDIVDPTRLNPELGSEDEFAALSADLRQRDMGLLLDFVPNHMSASHENSWWVDVLRHGRDSAHAGFFDLDWSSQRIALVIPPFLVLGNQVDLSYAALKDSISMGYHIAILAVGGIFALQLQKMYQGRPPSAEKPQPKSPYGRPLVKGDT